MKRTIAQLGEQQEDLYVVGSSPTHSLLFYILGGIRMSFKETMVKVMSAASQTVVKRSPEILTGLGITGMIGATVLAVKMTPEALKQIGKRKRELNVTKLSVKETIKVAGPCYIPVIATTAVSTACLVGASTINYKRNMALASAYALTETAFKDYKSAVEEQLTERETVKINDKIAEKKLEEHKVDDKEVIVTKNGNSLCYDITSGRYFRSDINKIKQTVNELNERLLNEQFISQNEFFIELGLEPVGSGYELGWDASSGLIRVSYSSQIASSGEPCLTINYTISPLTKYRH